MPLLMALLGLVGLMVQDLGAERRSIILGGDDGLEWANGGGTIAALVQTSPTEVESNNTPGNVLQFDAGGRLGWLAPQQADESINIALGLLDRGGRLNAPTILSQDIRDNLIFMVDNDPTTAFERKSVRGGTQVNSLGVIMDFDLGARFGVERIQFFPRNAHPDFPAPAFPFQNDYMRGFELLLNDGSEETQVANQPVLTTVRLVAENEEPIVELNIPPQYVRFIRLKSQTTVGFEIAEFRVFGSGFVPRADYISNIFDFGEELALWGRIRWEEEFAGTARLSRLRISSRSGWDATPLEFTRINDNGAEVPWQEGAVATSEAGGSIDLDAATELQEALDAFNALPFDQRDAIALTQDQYEDLRSSERGGVRDDLVAWSRWSPPYSLEAGTVSADNIVDDQVGVPILSPGPRRYFQLKAEFVSDELESARSLGALAFTVSNPPMAERILSEVAPRQVELGVPVSFIYAVLPTKMRRGVDLGFDLFEIATPVRVEEVERIEVVHADGQVQTADFTGVSLGSLPVEDPSGQFAVEAVEERRLLVRFPLIAESDLEAERVASVKIGFKCRVLRFGTTFSGTAWNSGTDNLGQRVIGGNAADLGPTDDDLIPLGVADPSDLAVQVPLTGGDLLVNVEARPRPFSPNGDGINDRVQIHYDLTRLVGAAPIAVRVFDLAGNLVRTLFAGEQGGGSFTAQWDGADGAGQQAPPGIYLFRVDLNTDAREEAVVGIVEMAY
ncbi:MAG: hypothetical protein GKR89_11800 [Candidatus Latescibacteria bacterium]|nr:hypothetical protein [Candidatus Latescibacterota bacterium]